MPLFFENKGVRIRHLKEEDDMNNESVKKISRLLKRAVTSSKLDYTNKVIDNDTTKSGVK